MAGWIQSIYASDFREVKRKKILVFFIRIEIASMSNQNFKKKNFFCTSHWAVSDSVQNVDGCSESHILTLYIYIHYNFSFLLIISDYQIIEFGSKMKSLIIVNMQILPEPLNLKKYHVLFVIINILAFIFK